MNQKSARKGKIISLALYDFDLSYLSGADANIAGVDEAGRGPLAGPVVAAAVVLDLRHPIPEVNDSKKLSPAKRERLFTTITNQALAYSTAIVDHKSIDEINILNASKRAMTLALRQLSLSIDMALTDALQLNDFSYPIHPIIKGDSKSASIAAASIIAKVTRDRLMQEYHKTYPLYNFSKHKGYPTKEHLTLLKQLGPSPIHRKTFSPVKKLLEAKLFET